ncbi:MAG TPA: fibronectin type III domain-containing protein [Polyangiaceae bacterium]|jgi:hypothetical protein|nr:fibronectin type III domain-containing protein [Polyangiaceae bacterium]
MKKPSTDRRIAALNLPRNVYKLLAIARAIAQAVGANAKTFTNPDPALVAITTAADELEAAQQKVDQKVKGAVDDRDARAVALVKLLHQEKGYVQKIADSGDPAHAADVIQSGGLSVKHVPVRAPRAFTAKFGPVSGSAALATAPAGRRSSYEWQYSVDGGKTWITAPPTTQTKTVVTGLQPGVAHAFRYRAVTKTGATDWSEPVTLVVR